MQYRYPNSKQIFTLKEIKGDTYIFTCGHWCFGSVFEDLINVKTGIANWEQPKLKLF